LRTSQKYRIAQCIKIAQVLGFDGAGYPQARS
jgi:hypothetical protein